MEIIQPHKKNSRDVTQKDIPKVKKLVPEMVKLCSTKRGLYKGGYALSHSQVEEKDPMRFFVTQDGNVYINPQIINHTQVLVDSEEACLSFPDKPIKVVPRYNKITVSISRAKDDSPPNIMNITGMLAKIFQHEIDHFDGKYIYDEDKA